MKKILLGCLCFVWALQDPLSAYIEDAPWAWDNMKYTLPANPMRISYTLRPEGNPVKTVLLSGIRFYQKNLSKLKHSKCPSYPSCSGYGYSSISSYGIWGLFMIIDRMYFRENNEQQYFYGLVVTSDGFRFYDPPENNFIFDKKKWRFK